MNAIELAERRFLPDAVVRFGMRRMMAQRLRAEGRGGDEAVAERQRQFVAELATSPIAIETQSANRQHYEVPAEFFRLHLGGRMKYSSCLYATGRESLAGAEQAMFAAYADRAELQDGQRILDLGCGWGSFALWAAARYQHSTIVGLSNSNGQREYIMARAAELGLTNVTIRTGNIVDFEFSPTELSGGFDRIVSVEMFEHMKNYRLLFAKVAGWLADDGRVFVHVFANRNLAYHFEDRESDDWMTRYFFSGGTMPSFDLFKSFADDLEIEKRWWVSGRHYERTANDWLRRMDAAEAPIMKVFEATYGPDAPIWFARWRMFYMAVAELFGFENGAQWGVGHYRFAKTGRAIRFA
ncbi:MAG: class I SAM-dependent methyltransferase [Burkholderiaceae bacterium]